MVLEPLSDETTDEAAEAPVAVEPQDGRAWFIVQTYSGYENKVKVDLEQRIKSMDMSERIHQVVVPTEDEIEIRTFRVRTRDGVRSFQTLRDEWPREMPDGALLIKDVAGDLYRVVEPRALDPRSRKRLAQDPEVAGDGGAADRQRPGDLIDGAGPGAEGVQDLPPHGVAQRVECGGGVHPISQQGLDKSNIAVT